MTPTEMALLRQQMGQGGGQNRQSGWGGPMHPATQPAPMMPQMPQQQPEMSYGRGSPPQFGGPNASPMSRMFPNMGMPNGVPSNITTTPMDNGPGSGAEGGRFMSGQRDLPMMKAMGK